MDSAIEKIRTSLSIETVWHLLNLPGKPGKECKSPFRPQEKSPSFSIYKKGGWERFYDHTTGLGGDCVDLWAQWKQITVKDAVSEILALRPHLSDPVKASKRPPEAFSPPEGILWPPDLRAPSEDECRALGKLRGLDPCAFDLAGRLGTLKVATVYGAPAWIVTDCAGIAAQARRFDGAMYSIKGKQVKGFALPGSEKYWPAGLLTENVQVNQGRRFVLVEGEPDYIAALHLCAEAALQNSLAGDVRPIVMFGGGLRIGPQTRKFIWGAEVLIIPHNDLTGAKSQSNWTEDLRQLGAARIIVQKLPFEHDDLNDFLRFQPDNPLQLLKGFQSEHNPGTKRT